MTTQEKPREFWLIRDVRRNYYEACTVKPSWNEIKLGDERIHVIEKSAFDAVVAERDECDLMIVKLMSEGAKMRNRYDQILKDKDADIQRLRKALRISGDKHEGMALCFEAHGLNLNLPFLIDDCRKDAQRARKALGGECG